MLKILDVGCGPGLYVEALRAAGLDAVGIDPDAAVAESPHIKRGSVFDDAFMEAYRGQFDVVMSLEVGEHLPPQLAFSFVERLVACLSPDGARRVLFSAAHPGQGGDGHINCQPKQYWQDLFGFLGFERNQALTDAFVGWMAQGYHMGWLRMNAMVLTPVQTSFGQRQFAGIAHEELPQARRIAEHIAAQWASEGIVRKDGFAVPDDS